MVYILFYQFVRAIGSARKAGHVTGEWLSIMHTKYSEIDRSCACAIQTKGVNRSETATDRIESHRVHVRDGNRNVPGSEQYALRRLADIG